MRRIQLALPAAAAAIALAGCGGSSHKSTSTTAAAVAVTQAASITTASTQTQAPSHAIRSSHRASRTTRSSHSAGGTAPATRTAAATTAAAITTKSTAATSPTTTPTTARRTLANHAKPKSPVPCLVEAGLKHAGASSQAGTWQGSDPASHRSIYVSGPYKSVADANSSASTLEGVNQVQRGGLWVVSASLRGGTGPAVKRVAQCLDGQHSSARSYSF